MGGSAGGLVGLSVAGSSSGLVRLAVSVGGRVGWQVGPGTYGCAGRRSGL